MFDFKIPYRIEVIADALGVSTIAVRVSGLLCHIIACKSEDTYRVFRCFD